jgi:hypothetical protein
MLNPRENLKGSPHAFFARGKVTKKQECFAVMPLRKGRKK